MAYNSDEIRGVMIQVGDERLLLPNATVAEVLAKVPVEPVEDAPDWLPGRIDWHGWQVPLVKFASLAGLQEDAAGRGNRVIVLKALGGDVKRPYFAMLTQGFPRLVTVTEAALATLDDGGDLPEGELARVRLNEDEAVVPDLAALELRLQEALAAAA